MFNLVYDSKPTQVRGGIYVIFFVFMHQFHTVLSHDQVEAQLDCGPAAEIGVARNSESRGPENGVSRWRWPNSDIYSQNGHFGLVYDTIPQWHDPAISQFLGMEAKK